MLIHVTNQALHPTSILSSHEPMFLGYWKCEVQLSASVVLPAEPEPPINVVISTIQPSLNHIVVSSLREVLTQGVIDTISEDLPLQPLNADLLCRTNLDIDLIRSSSTGLEWCFAECLISRLFSKIVMSRLICPFAMVQDLSDSSRTVLPLQALERPAREIPCPGLERADLTRFVACAEILSPSWSLCRAE